MWLLLSKLGNKLNKVYFQPEWVRLNGLTIPSIGEDMELPISYIAKILYIVGGSTI